jgi:D-alanyl-D-alanine carboxypeptidase
VKEVQQEKTDKELHPERYDKSLFRHAYKAGMELRKLKEEEERKKAIIGIILIILSLSLLFGGIYYFLNTRPPTYTSSIAWEIQEDPLIKSPTKIYGFENIDLEITAKSAMAFNPDSGEIFFAKDIDSRRQIASLTKIMTSMIVMENMLLDDVMTVDQIPTYGEDEIWSMELERGDQVTVENLLNMMLISSYNDAAIVLAESIGSEEFVSLMNSKLSVLGLQDTMFSNPCGFDSDENYSTISDLYKIIRVFLKYPTLTEKVNKLSTKVEYINEDGAIGKNIFTTHSLLEEVNVEGIKTGYTEDAGPCLITLYVYDDGSRLVVILLDSEDRYEETELIEGKVRALEDHQ